MAPYLRVVAFGCAAVVAFDAGASVASVVLGFPYVFAAVGSLVIYLAVGSAAVRYASVRGSALAGMVVGFVDATLGWTVSWFIGPGRPAADSLQLSRTIWTVVVITMLAGVAAGIGGALSGNKASPRRAAA